MNTASLDKERERIRFRQSLLACDGGTKWLLHIIRLFGCNEQRLGPSDFGLPMNIQQQLNASELTSRFLEG